MQTLTTSELKWIRSLSQKKFRDAEGLFIVEGEKLVDEAVRSDFEIVRLCRRDEIGAEQMARISQLSSPSPVLAVVRRRVHQAPRVPAGLCLGLDSVRDPGNLGTIIRLSDWFGIDMIYASRDCVELYNPKVVQATMGAIFRKKVVYTDLEAVCRDFRAAGLPVFGTFLDGESIYAKPLSPSGIVIMGNEANGISPALEALVDERLLIPSFTGGAPGAESLNVAIATAVTLSEFKRRSL